MKKSLSILLTTFLLSIIFVPVTFAHVVVKPAEVNTGAFQTFTIGVPNEQDNPTIGLRVVIPAGLEYVTPNVKPGWSIEKVTTGEGEKAKVTEIVWSGGSIPAGERDEFAFSAKVPTTEETLKWKAYQTYENGDVVAWDQSPDAEEKNDDHTTGPYSQTKIINDIKLESDLEKKDKEETKQATATMQMSFIALALSAVAIALQLRKKN